MTPAKRVAILQSAYIPWKGYFDIINKVDEFVIYDDCQYTRRDWRNRNRIKTANGTAWLTIPVAVKGRYTQRIDETVVSDATWARRHWRSLAENYAHTPCFRLYRDRLENFYLGSPPAMLSLVNRGLIDLVCEVLGIQTRLSWSTSYPSPGTRSERLLGVCQAARATTYLSGPSARAYLDESLFAAAGIAVEYMDYSGYPEYEQIHPPFEHKVSVLDLIFHTGPDAPSFMLSFDGP